MGSRGRMLGQAHWSLPSEYKCVNIINNVKVLKDSSGDHEHGLPTISHTPGTSYLDLNKDGTLHQLRIFDKSRHPIVDIDYGEHGEFGKQKTLHIHFWKGSTHNRNNARLFKRKDLKRYGKYLKGIIKDEWIK